MYRDSRRVERDAPSVSVPILVFSKPLATLQDMTLTEGTNRIDLHANEVRAVLVGFVPAPPRRHLRP